MCLGEGKQIFFIEIMQFYYVMYMATPLPWGAIKFTILKNNPWPSLLYILSLYHLNLIAEKIVKEIDDLSTFYPKLSPMGMVQDIFNFLSPYPTYQF